MASPTKAVDFATLGELDLVQRCAARDRDAIRYVITANNQRLFRAAWSVLKNRSEVGFRRNEAAFVLLGELGLLILLSLPIGIVLGIWLARYVTEQFSADLYTIPFGIHPATLAEGALVVMAAAALTALLIRVRVDDLDLVQALKTRE